MTLTDLAAWARVFGAVATYVVVALASARLISRTGKDLKEMRARTSTAVTVIALAGNLAILALVLLMLVLIDGRPISDLGLGLGTTDTTVLATFVALSVATAVLFLLWVRRAGAADVRRRARAGAATDVGGAMLTIAVLVVVALQEEVVFRGYVTINLLHLGWGVAAAASVVSFVGIHLLTNRTTAPQLASWTVGGTVLVIAYLLSGSLWVAVAIHLGMDLLNVVAFDIVGRFSLVTIDPPLQDSLRLGYRLGSSVAIVLLLLGAYGAHITPPAPTRQAQGAARCPPCRPQP